MDSQRRLRYMDMKKGIYNNNYVINEYDEYTTIVMS